MIRHSLAASILVLSAACARPLVSPPTPTPTPAAPPATLTYLGVAGWQLEGAGHALLVDPYFSRLDVDDPKAPIAPSEARILASAPARAEVILVEHSHYDHLLDVPFLAKRTGARVIGTDSSLAVARAAGLPDTQLLLARGGETFALGAFSVRAIRGLHSLTGQPNVPISVPVSLPMPAEGYAEGGTLQYLVTAFGRTVLFIGSANFAEDQVTGLRPDVAVIGVGLREKIPDYACRLMRALGNPKRVYTNHFDAHWEPLGPKQMSIGDESMAGLRRFADEVHACSPETSVVIPRHLEAMAL